MMLAGLTSRLHGSLDRLIESEAIVLSKPKQIYPQLDCLTEEKGPGKIE